MLIWLQARRKFTLAKVGCGKLRCQLFTRKRSLRRRWAWNRSNLFQPGNDNVLTTDLPRDLTPETIGKLWRAKTEAAVAELEPSETEVLTVEPLVIEQAAVQLFSVAVDCRHAGNQRSPVFVARKRRVPFAESLLKQTAVVGGRECGDLSE